MNYLAGSRSLRVLKFRINSAFLGFQMMNFCFGEGNGQLKQAGKPKPLTKAAGWGRLSLLGLPTWAELREASAWDFSFSLPQMPLRCPWRAGEAQGMLPGDAAWDGAVQTPGHPAAGSVSGWHRALSPRSSWCHPGACWAQRGLRDLGSRFLGKSRIYPNAEPAPFLCPGGFPGQIVYKRPGSQGKTHSDGDTGGRGAAGDNSCLLFKKRLNALLHWGAGKWVPAPGVGDTPSPRVHRWVWGQGTG